MKIAGVPKNAIRLNLFSFSPVGEAKEMVAMFQGERLEDMGVSGRGIFEEVFP